MADQWLPRPGQVSGDRETGGLGPSEEADVVWVIRAEAAGDAVAIQQVVRRAFGRDPEARLVDRLRAEGHVLCSLLAEEGGQVAGHVLFARLTVEATGPGIELAAAALAPLAVVPEHQGRGIGSALVRQGLAECARLGQAVVAVLGHPRYYARFGFSARLAERLHGPYRGEAWMAIEMLPGALRGRTATVRYPPPFAALE